MNIWHNLPKPFFALAPMEDVTDTVFRQIVTRAGRPDVFFTEFTNVDGILSAGNFQVAQRLRFTEKERPIVAQIWGTDPDKFYKVAQLLVELGFDGIDINFGCPERKIIKKGACSAMITNPSLARDIIQATREGAKNLPVSVKTRIGIKSIQTEEWVSFLLTTSLSALTIHARTVVEESKVPAHWDEIGKAVKIRNQLGANTIIIGNGDVSGREEGYQLTDRYGVEGIMIGRAVFHNISVFNRQTMGKELSKEVKLKVLLEHVKLFEQTWKESKNFAVMKKYFKIYVSGFDGASELRTQLMETRSADDVKNILKVFFPHN